MSVAMTQDGIETAIAGLRHEVSLLVQGLGQMLATQEIHTEMLRAIVAAATAPADGEEALTDVLARIAATLTDQAEALTGIREGIEKLPSEIGKAVSSRDPRGA
jgi:beta-phosphoglucomutase-like phosphatase (HAD superfamily)